MKNNNISFNSNSIKDNYPKKSSLSKETHTFKELNVSQILSDLKSNLIKLNIDKHHQYHSLISFNITLNSAVFTLFSEYFNILTEKKDIQKEQDVYVDGFIRNGRYEDNVDLSIMGTTMVLVNSEDCHLIFEFSKFFSGGELIYSLNISSRDETTISGMYFFKKMFFCAISMSNLKGSYFSMPRGVLSWNKKELEKRDFEDIYLPKSSVLDLKLYTKVFEKNDILMRYLLAGNPGTAKTEATLVIANVLNKKGVTIIKTSICDSFKEKVELAEILAPSLIILDDIDLSLGSRSKGMVASNNLQDFLDVLDGTDKMNQKVGILATTNSISLLDLAAQRPGRFDKLLAFDYITKDNIKNIILKSLRYNFDINNNHENINIFTDSKIIDAFYNKRVTGAYIFNQIKMIKRRIDTLGIKDISPEGIVKEITGEIETLEKLKKQNYLSDKLNKSSKGKSEIGFDYEEDFWDGPINDDIDTIDWEGEKNSSIKDSSFEE